MTNYIRATAGSLVIYRSRESGRIPCKSGPRCANSRAHGTGAIPPMHNQLNRSDLCECGCGDLTRIRDGRPNRFIAGHRSRLNVKAFEDCYLVAANGCWEWTSARDRDGYGVFSIKARPCRANRVAYERFVGPIPEGQCVLHRCDNPPCVNPAHLWLGTVPDNNADRHRKGRTVTGITAWKLTQQRADEIRERYAAKQANQYELAVEYGVSQSMVSLIVRGVRWTPTT